MNVQDQQCDLLSGLVAYAGVAAVIGIGRGEEIAMPVMSEVSSFEPTAPSIVIGF